MVGKIGVKNILADVYFLISIVFDSADLPGRFTEKKTSLCPLADARSERSHEVKFQ